MRLPSELTWDPLRRGVDLPLKAVYHPLGFAVEIRTNSSRVLDAAEESWSGFQQAWEDEPLHLRIAVSDEAPPAPIPSPLFRAQGHLLTLVADSRHFAACDLEAGFGFAWLTAAAVEQRRWLRFHYLEAIVYALLTYRRLTPIHAACVAGEGKGILLSGSPGAGKSCLAFACARDGLTFVSDDVAYLDRKSRDLTLLGQPRYLRIKEAALDLFPALQKHPSIEVDGETLVEVRMDELAGIETCQRCLAEHVVFLERKAGGSTELHPLEPQAALDRLLRDMPRYGEGVDREQVDSVSRLVGAGASVLRYSELPPAVGKIRELTGRRG